MKIAIHQPNFLPWLGYFYKMAQADIFVILENVQFEKNGLTNRVKIKTPRGASWLTIPVRQRLPQIIKEVHLINFEKTKQKHLKTLSLNYAKAPYLNFIFPEIKSVFEKDWQNLTDFNIALIKTIKEKLGLKTKIAIASDCPISGKADDLLINLCKFFKADTYISGQGGKKYQDEAKFKKAGLKLEYTNFVHPVYPQLWKDFLAGLSVIDLLFNQGPKSQKIILHS